MADQGIQGGLTAKDIRRQSWNTVQAARFLQDGQIYYCFSHNSGTAPVGSRSSAGIIRIGRKDTKGNILQRKVRILGNLQPRGHGCHSGVCLEGSRRLSTSRRGKMKRRGRTDQRPSCCCCIQKHQGGGDADLELPNVRNKRVVGLTPTCSCSQVDYSRHEYDTCLDR